MGASSSRRGMKRRSRFSGSRNREVHRPPNCAQSDPNAWADMQSTSTRECSSPSSIFAWMLSPGLSAPGPHLSTPSAHPSAAAPPQWSHYRLILRAVA